MKVLNRLCDGIIVISSYLEKFYKKNNIIKISPLVDLNNKKWLLGE